MPTASIKAEKEKQPPPPESNDPLRQGITIVEHKIRNLEKRKSRLDSYIQLQNSGKDLNSDQLSAIKKYDEVVHTLEFAREFAKQLNALSSESAKLVKKQLRKEAQERALQEISRTKEIFIIQDVLTHLGQENVRTDLTSGHEKVVLTQEELNQIDELFHELSPKIDSTIPYLDQFQSCSEHMCSLINGKNKEVCGSTYAELKTKLMSIVNSGYFNPAQLETPEVVPAPAAEEPVEPSVTPAEQQPPADAPAPVPATEQEVEAKKPESENVAYNLTFFPSNPPPPPPPVIQEVSQIESAMFQAQEAASSHLTAFKSGPIHFIQENEIEEETSIPTLTYTNQNFTPNVPVNKTEPAAEINEMGKTTHEEEWTSVGGGHRHDDGGDGHHDDLAEQQSNDGFIAANSGRGNRTWRGGRGARGGRGGNNMRNLSNRGGGGGYHQNGYRGGGGGGRGGSGGGRGGGRGGAGGGGGGGRGRPPSRMPRHQ